MERKRAARSAIELLLLLAALALVSIGVQRVNLRLEGEGREARAPGRIGPLPDGRVLRVASLGFERLVADLFWLRTVYYIGDEEVHAAGFPDVERLAQLVTDIDPQFRSAYVILTSVLTVLKTPTPFALEFLDKGLRHTGDYWKLHFLKGFTLFYDFQRYREAARHIEAAYRHGGPPYLQLLATRLWAEGGSPETALAFLAARLRETDDPQAKRKLEKRFRALWVARDLAAIESALEAYRARHGGRVPTELSTLVAAGLLPAEPRDPESRPYTIVDGRAHAVERYETLEIHRAGGTP